MSAKRDLLFCRSGRPIRDTVPRSERMTLSKFPPMRDHRGPDPFSPTLFSGGSQGALPSSYPSVSEGPNMYPITQPGGNGGGTRNCSFPGSCGQGTYRGPVANEGGQFYTLWVALGVAAIVLYYYSTR